MNRDGLARASVLVAALLFGGGAWGESAAVAEGTPGYAGAAVCAACHAEEHEGWSRSHHARAMEPATQATVLGDFDDVRFEYAGKSTRFFRRDGRFMVETEGPDGKPTEYVIDYTFGYQPLQQYLIAFPGGRYQSLSIAWDSRPAAEGGQRWFHLYPDEAITAGDPLHWTGPYQLWNSRCADCHSTALERGFDPQKASYDTRWAEINVGCEACHGPGAEHVRRARERQTGGLAIDPGRRGHWRFVGQAPIASLEGESTIDRQLAVCAPCHSRRTNIADVGPAPPYLDAHVPALLEPGLYHADGQILDEVYVYGSFLQSRMYQRGVVCVDCHEPHTMSLRAEGNGVCAQCHRPEVYDVASHHRHRPGGAGAQCADCHMPARTYMVVDPRRDHSFRIPDPWLSIEAGVPNACVSCHEDKDAAWAVARFDDWAIERRVDSPAAQLARSRGADVTAIRATRTLAAGPFASMQRATALAGLQAVSEKDLDILAKGLRDPDPLVRLGAVRAFGSVAPEYARAMVWPLLRDPRKAVRFEALRILISVPASELGEAQRVERAEVREEYVRAQRASDGLAAGALNLAALYAAEGRLEEAEKAYRDALAREPALVPAWLNLADLYRVRGMEREAGKALERALAVAPESAAAHHALGLHLVRTARRDEAMAELERAYDLEPSNARYAYVLAIALQSAGQTRKAMRVAEKLSVEQPANLEALQLLLSLNQEEGRVEQVADILNRIQSLKKVLME